MTGATHSGGVVSTPQSARAGSTAAAGRHAHGPDLLARCAAAEHVLKVAVATAGTWVDAARFAAAWAEATGSAPPAAVPRRPARLLAPAIEAGRVLKERHRGVTYYVPCDRRALPIPEPASDSARLERAVAAATARLGGAVSCEDVEAEIAATPALALKSSRVPVSTRLQGLALAGRIQIVRPGGRSGRTGVYYAPLGGPRRVAPASRRSIDRRVRVIRALWRRSGGRPFTTRAISRYADARPGLDVGEAPAYAWSNALQALEATGFLVKVDKGRGRFAKWAVAADWAALDQQVRDERLRDPMGRDGPPAPAPRGGARSGPGANTPHPAVDVGAASRNRDMRVLVEFAQRAAGEAEVEPERRAIRRERPVTAADIDGVRAEHPRLLPRRVSASRALLEASRARPTNPRPALTWVGTAGGIAYFAAAATAPAAAYVAYRAALAVADPVWLAKTAARLATAAAHAATRVIPLPRGVLLARAEALAGEADLAHQRLTDAMAAARLLSEEAAHARDILASLAAARAAARAAVGGGQEQLEGVPPLEPLEPGTLPPAMCVETSVAWQQLQGLAPYALPSPSVLLGRLRNSVRSVRPCEGGGTPPGEASSEFRRRGATLHFDRVAFACYVASRWGGPPYAALGAQARHILGALRDAAPLAAALMGAASPSTHVALCAGLGMLDDPAARAALAAYLLEGATGAQARWGRPAPAAAMAAYALAPRPCGGLTDRLSASDRTALEAAMDHGDGAVRRTATATLRAWDERWDRDRLLLL